MQPQDLPEPATRLWHGWPVDELVRHLDTDLNLGLSPVAATDALARHGPNALPEIPARGLGRMVAGQHAD